MWDVLSPQDLQIKLCSKRCAHRCNMIKTRTIGKHVHRISVWDLLAGVWSKWCEKNRKNATTPFVPKETLLFVSQSLTIQEIRCTIALWSKPMHTQKRTFSRCKLVYNEIKRWGQKLCFSAVVVMATKILLFRVAQVQLAWVPWLVNWAREKEILIII